MNVHLSAGESVVGVVCTACLVVEGSVPELYDESQPANARSAIADSATRRVVVLVLGIVPAPSRTSRNFPARP